MKHKTETILTNPIKTLKKWPTSKNEIFATFLKILSTTNEIYFKILNFEKPFKDIEKLSWQPESERLISQKEENFREVRR